MIAPARHPIRQPFAGGLEALVWHLVDALRVRGHHVTLFGAHGSDAADPGHAFPSGGWEPSRLAAADPSMASRAFLAEHHAYLRLMVALAGPMSRRFDVVHNHSLHHLPVSMAATVPVPMVTSLHTPPTPWLESAIEIGGGRGTTFTCVSGFTAAQWSVLGRSPLVVRNGVGASRWPMGPGGTDLVWSGRIVPEKAPHLAIEAARRAGRGLRLVGPIDDPAYFDRMITPRLGVDVRYLGHLGQRDLAEVIGESSVALVTPMWDEPYGLVVAESMACGTPVVAFDRGGVPETFSAASGVLVPPGDVAAMAAAVPQVCTLDRLGVRQHAVTDLSLDRMVAEYLRLYRAVGSRRSQEPSAVRLTSPSLSNASSHPVIGYQPQRL